MIELSLIPWFLFFYIKCFLFFFGKTNARGILVNAPIFSFCVCREYGMTLVEICVFIRMHSICMKVP